MKFSAKKKIEQKKSIFGKTGQGILEQTLIKDTPLKIKPSLNPITLFLELGNGIGLILA